MVGGFLALRHQIDNKGRNGGPGETLTAVRIVKLAKWKRQTRDPERKPTRNLAETLAKNFPSSTC